MCHSLCVNVTSLCVSVMYYNSILDEERSNIIGQDVLPHQCTVRVFNLKGLKFSWISWLFAIHENVKMITSLHKL